MVREKDKPYIRKMKELEGSDITSDQIDRAVYAVNMETGLYYSGGDVVRIMQFCDIIDIQSHLGQPRHGAVINGGRLHTFQVYWNEL